MKSTFILARLNNNFGVGFRDHEKAFRDLGFGFVVEWMRRSAQKSC